MVPLSLLVGLLLVDASMNAQESIPEVVQPLPSAVHCAALFSLTHEMLTQKSGDPSMTEGFAADAAALRRIVIAEEGPAPDAEARADAAISVERKALASQLAARRAKGEDSADELSRCYRVKALGPRG